MSEKIQQLKDQLLHWQEQKEFSEMIGETNLTANKRIDDILKELESLEETK